MKVNKNAPVSFKHVCMIAKIWEQLNWLSLHFMLDTFINVY
jgi:hypothetical protein